MLKPYISSCFIYQTKVDGHDYSYKGLLISAEVHLLDATFSCQRTQSVLQPLLKPVL